MVLQERLQMLTALILLLLATVCAPAGAAPAPEEATAARLRLLLGIIQEHGVQEVPAARLTQGALEAIRQTVGTSPPPAGTTLEEKLHQLVQNQPAPAWNQLERKAVEGMLAQLNDRWAAYLSADSYTGWRQRNAPEGYGGTGLQVVREGHATPLLICQPWPQTPAARAGLLGGDELLTINGLPVQGMTEEEARAHLQAAPGTPLQLTWRREGQGFAANVVCARVEGAVHGRLLEQAGHKLGYIEVRTFATNTPGAVARVLDELARQGAQGCILDLRNNGGGTVTSAVQLASLFLPAGSRVVSIDRRQGTEVLRASGRGPRLAGPLLVLINENSASASELTAGALRDSGRAVLVGHKSYGKGAVCRIVPLADGSALKLTTAYYRTPAGQSIEGRGLSPQISVDTAFKQLGGAADQQLQAALDLAVRRLQGQQVGRNS